MQYAYQIFDVFSTRPFGGNQLSVLMNAEGLSTQAMQAIAREFNFAETTFVLPPANPAHTKRVRIFTPNAEVDFAGHPTIGTACALVRHEPALPNPKTYSLILEERVGPVRVEVSEQITGVSAMLTLERNVDQPMTAPARQQLAEVLSLPDSCVLGGFFASVGLPLCFAHLSTPADVDRGVIDTAAWRAHLANAWSSNIFFFAGDLKHGSEPYARMSAPALGVMEAPATGSACAALAGALAHGSASEVFALSITQGVAMGRPSETKASARKRDGKVASVSVGGPAAFVASGEISVPDAFLT